MVKSKMQKLYELESKGVPKTHIEILIQFLKLEGQTITDSKQIMGIKGKSPIPPNSIVSKPHYLHNLIRGVYKPINDDFALSIQLKSTTKYGSEIIYSDKTWKIIYDFKVRLTNTKDIASLEKCISEEVPIGVIDKPKPKTNKILGLGKIKKLDEVRFEITPYRECTQIKELDDLASSYIKDKVKRNDFSSNGSLKTVQGRALTKFFKDQLLIQYEGKCTFCELNIESLLTGAHIVPYAIMKKNDPTNAMNPSNGLLLCKLCDKAFEDGDIKVTNEFNIFPSDKLKSASNPVVRNWISHISQKIEIKNNTKYKPDSKYFIHKLKILAKKNNI